MIRKIRDTYENANIVPIDYDPGATKVNQENRIKLMLAVAKENLMFKQNIEKNINKTTGAVFNLNTLFAMGRSPGDHARRANRRDACGTGQVYRGKDQDI